MSKRDKTRKVNALAEGTVLDHLRAGTALAALRVLHLPPGATVTIGINLQSRRLGKKDIIKVEGHELGGDDAAKVALISPDATLTIIRDYEVVGKHDLFPPVSFRGLIRCINTGCITRAEKHPGSFLVKHSDPVTVRCEYCSQAMKLDQFEWI